MRIVHRVNSGHPAGSFGCTDFRVTLYNEVLELKDGFDMNGLNEDVFFVFNGKNGYYFFDSVWSSRIRFSSNVGN